MRFSCGPSPNERARRALEEEDRIKAGLHPRQQWQPFFALWPVRVGENDCRWLEMVEIRERRVYGCYGDDYWEAEYRLPKP
jgi:hypothetical protein